MPQSRKFLWLMALAILGAVLVLAACGGSSEPELPDTTEASLLAYLDEVDYQGNWDLWPNSTEKYPGEDPHGALLTIRMNDAAFNAVGGAMPDGAIIVKENHTPAGDLAAITVMYKKSGYAPEHGDWFWLKNTTDGSDDRAGRAGGLPGLPRRRHRLRLWPAAVDEFPARPLSSHSRRRALLPAPLFCLHQDLPG